MSARSDKQDVSQGGAISQERVAYTMPQAAALLGVSERYLWKLAQQGDLPLVHLGGRTLVRRSTLERLVEERETAGRLRMVK